MATVVNQRLINEVAVGIVVVQGPTPDLRMELSEVIQAAAEVAEGHNLLASFEPAAKVSWVYDLKTVSIDEAPWPNAPWKGLPREFYQKSIDAALWRESNQKVYLFHKDQYVRLTGSTADGDPKPIKGNWKGLPSEFEEGIDAAFWHKTDGKIYMFKGGQFVRLTETVVDDTYPKPIAGNWKGLPSSFEQGIDAAFMDPKTNKIYMFKGDQCVRLTGSTVDGGYPQSIKENFKGLPEYMESGIQAALWRGDNGKVYLFGKPSRQNLTTYARFSDITQPVDSTYPKYVGGLDADQAEALWRDPAQAALGVSPGSQGYEDYVAQLRQSFGTEWGIVIFITKYPADWPAYTRGRIGKPRRIVLAWTDFDSWDRTVAHETGHTFGAPDEYSSSNCSCKASGRFFRVRNGNCQLCTNEVSMEDNYPKSIAGPWKNLPASFQSGIDAALWREDNRKVYFFKGDQYVQLTDTTMDGGFPKPIAGNWKGLPASFQSGIDAAVWRKSNNRIYMFKGSEYVQLTGSTMDSGFPKPIKGNWKGLPPSFEQGIDAALWREVNDKIYMFKGSEYVGFTDMTMDPIYPRTIQGNWHGLPASFTQGLNAAFTHRDRKRMYLFKDSQYASMVDGVPCLMLWNNPVLCSYTPFHLGWGAFLEKIDAAVWTKDDGKTYLFSGAWCVRYSNINDGIDEGYPQRISEHWKGLPKEFHSDLDAALFRDSNGKLYFFKGDQYVRLTGSTMDDTYPKPIKGNWQGLPPSFEQGIDAAFLRELNGKIYMFKGNEYVRLTETVKDDTYPKPIAGNWPGLPSGYTSGLDAALMRWDTHQIYFFKGRTYVRYSNVANGIDQDYPLWINKRWMPFPT
jgi:hypothetical protein